MGLLRIRSAFTRRSTAPRDRRDAQPPAHESQIIVVKPPLAEASKTLRLPTTQSPAPEPCRFIVTAAKLGRGAYGSVLVGVRCAADEEVAVKIIADGRMKPAALQKEVSLLRRLSASEHPALPRFHGHYSPEEVRAGAVVAGCNEADLPLSQPLGECHCLAMEMARGGELFEYVVSRGGLPEPEAAALAAQMCEAVRAAHALGVAHRDLKLENVLFLGAPGERDADRITLIDWGLAHQHAVRDDGSVTSEVLRSRCGSRSYMAPEVADRSPQRRGYDGFVCDVWSLGVCIFAMVFGFFPFEQADPSCDWRARKVLEAQRAGRSALDTIIGFYPKRHFRLSTPLRALLDRMLVFDPSDRASLREVLGAEWLAPHVEPNSPMEVELEPSASRSPAPSSSSVASDCSAATTRLAAEGPTDAHHAATPAAAAACDESRAAAPSSPLQRCRTWAGHADGRQDEARPRTASATVQHAAPSPAGLGRVAARSSHQPPPTPPPQWVEVPRAERQDSESTAASTTSSVGSSVVRSMARLQHLVERGQPSTRPPQQPAVRYALASHPRPPPPPRGDHRPPNHPRHAQREPQQPMSMWYRM